MYTENSNSKRCTKCKEVKPVSEFSPHPKTKDKLNIYCKPCAVLKVKLHRQTRAGLSYGILADQRKNSKRRGYAPPNYSLIEFRLWLFSQVNFDDLYANWESSGHDTNLRPSCDRLDNYKPYTLGNLRLTTWEINQAAAYSDMRNGINTKTSKGVVQLSLEGKFIAEFPSMSSAERGTPARASKICLVCKGSRKSAGGFNWMLAKEYYKEK